MQRNAALHRGVAAANVWIISFSICMKFLVEIRVIYFLHLLSRWNLGKVNFYLGLT